mgnify:CR=1 FL=1
MILKSISLTNYRNFESYSIELGQRTTMLIGRNGMGKTNLLSSMVQALSFIFSKQRDMPQTEFIRSSDQGVRRFAATDARYTTDYQYPNYIKGKALLANGQRLDWGLEQEGRKSGLRDSKFRDAYLQFWKYYNREEEKPVLAFFSDGFPHKNTRLSAAMKERLESGFPLPANTGYYQWDQDQSCVEIWKRYYTQQWINGKLDGKAERIAFVEAIKEKLIEFSKPMEENLESDELTIEDLFAEMRNDQAVLMIKLAGKDTAVPFDSLPQGYNRLFSMVLDVACRSYLLNGNCNPDGIVFIDEIEVHLHPTLAISVLQRLRRSFERIQFIVSTHSPLVITNFDQKGADEDNRLYQLTYEDGVYGSKRIDDVYGLDYNEGLTTVMMAQDRNRNMEEIKALYQYWKERDPHKAALVAAKIRQEYSHNVNFIRELGL